MCVIVKWCELKILWKGEMWCGVVVMWCGGKEEACYNVDRVTVDVTSVWMWRQCVHNESMTCEMSSGGGCGW